MTAAVEVNSKHDYEKLKLGRRFYWLFYALYKNSPWIDTGQSWNIFVYSIFITKEKQIAYIYIMIVKISYTFNYCINLYSILEVSGWYFFNIIKNDLADSPFIYSSV